MKNLNDLGVQEMDTREMKEENGGELMWIGNELYDVWLKGGIRYARLIESLA